MALAYLFDENLPARLWHAIRRHNDSAELTLDVIRIGEPPNLPLSSDDLSVLKWAAQHDRILVSQDKRTLPAHLEESLAAGLDSPGVFIVRRNSDVPQLVEFLLLAAYASESAEWRNRVEYIPL